MPLQFVFGYKAAMITGAALGGAGLAIFHHWDEIKFMWEHREEYAKEAHARYQEHKRTVEDRSNDEFPSHEFDRDPEKMPDASHFEIDSSLESCLDDDAPGSGSGHSSGWEHVPRHKHHPECRFKHRGRRVEADEATETEGGEWRGERRRHRHERFGERSHCRGKCFGKRGKRGERGERGERFEAWAEGRPEGRPMGRGGHRHQWFGDRSERGGHGRHHWFYDEVRGDIPDEATGEAAELSEHAGELSTDMSERLNRRSHRHMRSADDSGSEGSAEFRRHHGFTMPTPNSSGTLPSDRSRSASVASSNGFSEYSVIQGEFSD